VSLERTGINKEQVEKRNSNKKEGSKRREMKRSNKKISPLICFAEIHPSPSLQK
jgi:hypothetical protein